MKIETMRDLYMHELKDLYNAEQQITQALPKMIKKTSHEELKNAFNEHLELTREHAKRLETLLDKMGEKASGEKCKAMEGLVREGEDVMKDVQEPKVMDAALIASAQRVEHYEMAGYGTARTYARMLGEEEAVSTLQKTLDEEAAADEKLTQLAEKLVNREAASAAST